MSTKGKELSDKRQKVEEPYLFPWNINGFMKMTRKLDQGRYRHYIGSGILLDKNILLTAGHCLYNRDCGAFNNIKFHPGRHGNIAASTLKIKKSLLSNEWRTYQDEDHDIGIAILDSNYKAESYGNLRVLSDDELLNLVVRISGYPGDKRDKKGLPYMYTMHGPIVTIKKNKFYYRIDTTGGQSGSGVLVENDFQKKINSCVGIHVTGCPEEGNGAVRINREKAKLIETWIKQQ